MIIKHDNSYFNENKKTPADMYRCFTKKGGHLIQAAYKSDQPNQIPHSLSLL